MCGLAGMYTLKYTARDQAVFRNLLLINTLRGTDSTGIARVTRGGKPHIIRDAVRASRFLRKPAVAEFIDPKVDPLVLIGHTRAATKGSITVKNAHPFAFENVIGAMNGTFFGTFDNSEKFETDTEAIYYNIDRAIANGEGIAKGIERSMVWTPKFALSFVNRKNNTLNFVRNKERPLSFAYIDGRQTLVWSSDHEHLEYVLGELMKVPYTGWKPTDKSKTFTLSEHDMLTIDIGQPPTKPRLSHLVIEPKKVYNVGGKNNHYRSMLQDWEDYDAPFDGGTSSGASDKFLIRCADGQYRTQEAEARRLGNTFRTPNTGTSSGSNAAKATQSVNSSKYDGRDLSTLAWLKEARDTEEHRRQLANAAIKRQRTFPATPQSPQEMKYRLKQGCVCCNKTVQYTDTTNLPRVKWIDRKHYACGDCYENSGNDWVKMVVDGEVPVSIMVH